MGLLEKLRPTPRWKHADPAVRAAAVYEIGADDADALRALAQEDADPRVRRAAVTRIDDAAVLADVARQDPDEDVRGEALRHLAGLATEAADAVRATAIVQHLLALGRHREAMVVARDSTVAPLRAPNAAWLVPPPKALAMSPPLPCWRRITSTSTRHTST